MMVRYDRGGTLKDDELTAAQLRARHGIPANRDNFASIGEKGGGSNMIVIVIALMVVLGAIYFIMSSKD